MKIIFMGTPAFALPALEALIDSPHEIIAVYTQPPRPAGRGMKLAPSPVQMLAEKHGIEFRTPESLKSPDAQKEFAALGTDIAVVAAYGLLLPKPILDAPKFGCINIHPSDLPRWRGAAPIAHTLMAGDTATACCIMRMEEGLDTGPVLARAPFDISPETNAGELHDTMAKLGAKLMLDVLEQFDSSRPPSPKPQSANGIIYAAKITRADQAIDWSRPAVEIVNQIRGLSPAPGAVTELAGEMVKIFAAEAEKGQPDQPPGTVLDKDLLINAGSGSAVRLLDLQRPGRGRQPAALFLQGFNVPVGRHAH